MGFEGLPLGSGLSLVSGGLLCGLGVSYGVWGGPVGFEGLPLGSGFHLGSGGVLWGLGVSYGVWGGLGGLRGSHWGLVSHWDLEGSCVVWGGPMVSGGSHGRMPCFEEGSHRLLSPFPPPFYFRTAAVPTWRRSRFASWIFTSTNPCSAAATAWSCSSTCCRLGGGGGNPPQNLQSNPQTPF